MAFRFSVLASGSTGNAMVVDNGEVRLLVDAGLSAKKMEELMQARDISCTQLDGILVTHEHADHIKGLGVLSRKYKLPIYANEKTWAEIRPKIGEIDEANEKMFETGATLDFGNLKVTSFEISHDAADPVGYSFEQNDYKLSLITDTGYVSPKIVREAADSDALILECNHDIDMLRVGRYPWNVKRRILSDLGHLSNEAAGEALYELVSEKTRRIYMAHLSRDHNMMDLARMTVSEHLNQCKVKKKDRIQLMDTYFDRPTLWDDLSSL